MFSQFPGASFGWSRQEFKGKPKLESELLNDNYTPKTDYIDNTDENQDEGKPTYEDYKWNGQHCKSGVAFYNPEEGSAECADPEKMWVY